MNAAGGTALGQAADLAERISAIATETAAAAAVEEQQISGGRRRGQRGERGREARPQKMAVDTHAIAPPIAQEEREIVLREKWVNGYNDAWLVAYDGPDGRRHADYTNDRPPHIAVGEDCMDEYHAGQRFTLRNKHRVGPATMWEVADTGLHFTIAFNR